MKQEELQEHLTAEVLAVIRAFDYYKQYDAYQKLIRVDVEYDDLLAILQETKLI